MTGGEAAEKVVSLHGDLLPGQVDGDLVTELQRLLDAAKSGELLAIAYGTVSQGQRKGTGWCGTTSGTADGISTAILQLMQRYSAALLEYDT